MCSLTLQFSPIVQFAHHVENSFKGRSGEGRIASEIEASLKTGLSEAAGSF